MDLVVIGGSDAGISAGLRARELDPDCRVTLIVADEYPNFSICGIPYLISGDVVDRRELAHRTYADLVDAGCSFVSEPVRRLLTRPGERCMSSPRTAGRKPCPTTRWSWAPVPFPWSSPSQV